MNVPLSVIGFRLGLYKAMADGEPVTPAELAERTGTHERYVREWLAGQARRRLRRVRPRDRDATACRPSTPRCWPTRTAPSTRAACSSRRARPCSPRTTSPSASSPVTASAGTSTTTTCSTGTASVFGIAYQHPAGAGVDPGARGRRGEARARRAGGRRRLRPRDLDDPDGRGLPAVHVRRLRLPRGVDREGPPPRRHGRRRGPRAVRARHGDRLPGLGLRPRGLLRRPARHGRPGRRRRATSGRRWPRTARG